MTDLPRSVLGRTGLAVTRLGYGAMELRRGDLQPGDLKVLLNSMLDAGINFIDTSPDYGASEARIGEHISRRRDEFILASKCGCPVGQAPVAGTPAPHSYTPANVRAGVEQSLRRMRTDHLDLVELHGNPSRQQLEDDRTLDELLALKEAGKVRFVGMSGQLAHLIDHLAMGVFDAFQVPYSAVERDHEQVIGDAARGGSGTIIRGAVARGALEESEPHADQRQRPLVRRGIELWRAQRLDELLDGSSRPEFLLRFALSHPQVDTAIVGTASWDHLAENVVAAQKGPLPPTIYEEAKRRLDLNAATEPAEGGHEQRPARPGESRREPVPAPGVARGRLARLWSGLKGHGGSTPE